MKTALSSLAFLALAATAVGAGWGPDPVTVTPTALSIPVVSACSDGSFGTFVAWQEESAPAKGRVRLQHLLPTGDLDPIWPVAGALACTISTARSSVGVLPDRQGGVYVWWLEGLSFYLSRLGPDGAVAAGWPARGRLLGGTSTVSPLPCVIEDGANGIYAAWSTEDGGYFEDPYRIRAIHLAPSNTGAAGWPNGPRALTAGDITTTLEHWPRIALAPDGGCFLAWASWSLDTTVVPSALHLRRLTPDGLNAAGWPADGVSLRTFRGEALAAGYDYRSALVDLDADGRGGVWLLAGQPYRDDADNPCVESRLYRRQGDGATASDWPNAGRTVPFASSLYQGYGEPTSLRVLGDARDGAAVGVPLFYDHGVDFAFKRCAASGMWDDASYVGGYYLHDVSQRPTSGLFLASFNPSGPSGPFSPDAFLAVDQGPAPPGWSAWSESHPDPVITWYGDIAIASSGDGGAVFFWSQGRERIGLFARRFGPAGQTTAVPGAPATFGLRAAAYVLGAGIRTRAALPVGTDGRLDVFDLAGRRVASTRLVGSGERESIVPGTAALRSGLYLVRLSAAGWRVTVKALVRR